MITNLTDINSNGFHVLAADDNFKPCLFYSSIAAMTNSQGSGNQVALIIS